MGAITNAIPVVDVPSTADYTSARLPHCRVPLDPPSVLLTHLLGKAVGDPGALYADSSES